MLPQLDSNSCVCFPVMIRSSTMKISDILAGNVVKQKFSKEDPVARLVGLARNVEFGQHINNSAFSAFLLKTSPGLYKLVEKEDNIGSAAIKLGAISRNQEMAAAVLAFFDFKRTVHSLRDQGWTKEQAVYYKELDPELVNTVWDLKI